MHRKIHFVPNKTQFNYYTIIYVSYLIINLLFNFFKLFKVKTVSVNTIRTLLLGLRDL